MGSPIQHASDSVHVWDEIFELRSMTDTMYNCDEIDFDSSLPSRLVKALLLLSNRDDRLSNRGFDVPSVGNSGD